MKKSTQKTNSNTLYKTKFKILKLNSSSQHVAPCFQRVLQGRKFNFQDPAPNSLFARRKESGSILDLTLNQELEFRFFLVSKEKLKVFETHVIFESRESKLKNVRSYVKSRIDPDSLMHGPNCTSVNRKIKIRVFSYTTKKVVRFFSFPTEVKRYKIDQTPGRSF